MLAKEFYQKRTVAIVCDEVHTVDWYEIKFSNSYFKSDKPEELSGIFASHEL